jgi:hypothetical protein
VGKYFIEHIDAFARRVLPVGMNSSTFNNSAMEWEEIEIKTNENSWLTSGERLSQRRLEAVIFPMCNAEIRRSYRNTFVGI